MSYSLVSKKKTDSKSQGGGANSKQQSQSKNAPKKSGDMKVDALSTLTMKEGERQLLSYSINDQKNHVGKKFTAGEEEKEFTVFVKEINADAVTVSVKGPGMFESKQMSRSPVGSPAGGALPSPQTILGIEFSLSGVVPVKKSTGMT